MIMVRWILYFYDNVINMSINTINNSLQLLFSILISIQSIPFLVECFICSYQLEQLINIMPFNNIPFPIINCIQHYFLLIFLEDLLQILDDLRPHLLPTSFNYAANLSFIYHSLSVYLPIILFHDLFDFPVYLMNRFINNPQTIQSISH